MLPLDCGQYPQDRSVFDLTDDVWDDGLSQLDGSLSMMPKI